MAPYRHKGQRTTAYHHAVIEDHCMARYLLIGPTGAAREYEDFARRSKHNRNGG